MRLWRLHWGMGPEGITHSRIDGERPAFDQHDEYNGHVMNQWAEVPVVAVDDVVSALLAIDVDYQAKGFPKTSPERELVQGYVDALVLK